MNLRVRRFRDTDLLAYLDNLIFPEDDPIAPYRDLWWGAFWDDLLVGYAGLSYEGDLIRAGVREEYRGRGIHRRLIDVRLREARRRGIQYVNTYTALESIQSMRDLAARGFLPTKQEDGFLFWSRKLWQ